MLKYWSTRLILAFWIWVQVFLFIDLCDLSFPIYLDFIHYAFGLSLNFKFTFPMIHQSTYYDDNIILVIIFC